MLHLGSLLAKLIPGTCVTARELLYSGESSRLQNGFIASSWCNSRGTRPVRAAIQNHIKRARVWGEGRSNDHTPAAAPTVVYWKLWRILKPCNLNGSAAVKAPEPQRHLCLLFFVHSSNLFILTAPLGSQCTRPRTETDAAALLSCWTSVAVTAGFFIEE